VSTEIPSFQIFKGLIIVPSSFGGAHETSGPSIFFVGDKPICQLIRSSLTRDPIKKLKDGLSRLINSKQGYALNTLKNATTRVCIKIEHVEGDIQYFNNLSIIHAQGAFKPHSGRHLIHMFLRDLKYVFKKPIKY
jgi:hypothetical protein